MERRLAAILVADVVGYSKQMAKDEIGTLSELSRLIKELIDPLIASHNGRIVKLMGDGVLAEFASAVDAVNCAIEWQNQLLNEGSIRFRIGINLGDIIFQGDDIFGTGVNIAARLETLADPGGICVSDDVFRQANGKTGASFEDIGEQTLKNIDEPVRTYRVVQEQQEYQSVRDTESFGNVGKPTIAILPFDNMSGDSDQEYFSDGISEDIITELSRFSELFVIARNSSFAFKGQKISAKELAGKLGVHYLVEGSVRKSGKRVRVTAQLIDAVNDSHLWADRFDRELEDVFEVQDDVVRAIVGVLPGRLAEAGGNRIRRKPAANMTAYDYFLRGNHALANRGSQIKTAIGHYKSAIKLDEDFAAAYASISIAEGMSVWDLSTYDDDPLSRAYDAGLRALELDPSDYRSHAAYGETTRQLGQHSFARDHLNRAMKLNPNSAQVLGYWAMLQAYTGDPEGAIKTYNRAVYLDPFSQDNLRKEIPAESYYNMREYQKSIDVLTSMLKLPIFYAHQQIAIAYAQLGNMDESMRHMELYRAKLPDFYDEMLLYESHIRLCALDEDREHWRQGYRLIGLDV